MRSDPPPRSRRLAAASRWLAAGLPTLALGLVALLAPATAGAATVEVQVRNFFFDPATVTIDAGDTVSWTNAVGPHNVVADDRSFSSGPPDSTAWTYSRAFATPGSFGYYCQPHRGNGMRGRVIVRQGSGEQPGTLVLAAGQVTVAEGGAATLTVQRLAGVAGVVAVSYVTAPESATAGADYASASGVLSWGDGDAGPKAIRITTRQDQLVESSETLRVILSNPTGGALLGIPASAVIAILDDDVGSGPPTAPGNLQVMPHSGSEMMLSWSDASGETGYRVEARKRGEAAFALVDSPGMDATGTLVAGLEAGTFYSFRVRAENGAGSSAYSNEVGDSTDAVVAPCVASEQVLCLNRERFEVRVGWRTASAAGAARALPVPGAPDSGLFYFFARSNVEMLIKVLDACVPPFDHYWVYFAATTDVELEVVVTDTETGRRRHYFNPLGRPAPPVQDSSAFATCP